MRPLLFIIACLMAATSIALFAVQIAMYVLLDVGESVRLGHIARWSFTSGNDGLSIAHQSTVIFTVPYLLPGAVIGIGAAAMWWSFRPSGLSSRFEVIGKPLKVLPIRRERRWRRKPWERRD